MKIWMYEKGDKGHMLQIKDRLRGGGPLKGIEYV